MTNEKNIFILHNIVKKKLNNMDLKIKDSIDYNLFYDDIFYEIFTYAINNASIYIMCEKKGNCYVEYEKFYAFIYNAIEMYALKFIYDSLDVNDLQKKKGKGKKIEEDIEYIETYNC
jgi:hypothetical protein